MIGRVALVLIVGALLMSLVMTLGLSRSASAQDPEPTPVGQLVGTWLLSFTEPDQAPAQASFGDDGLVQFTDAAENRGAGVWVPRGPRSGVVGIVVRQTDASEQPARMTILQGQIEVVTRGDTATLVYTVETGDGIATTPERAGPFTATAQRVDGQLIVLTPE